MTMKMRKTPRFPKWLFLVLLGMTCAAATGTAVWYDLTYNSGRLVYPMDSYAFQPMDIPGLEGIGIHRVDKPSSPWIFL